MPQKDNRFCNPVVEHTSVVVAIAPSPAFSCHKKDNRFCNPFVEHWRSGNIKGTAQSSEIHAQSETSVKPIYFAALCLPATAPAPIKEIMKSEERRQSFDPDRCDIRHPNTYQKEELVALCKRKGEKCKRQMET